MGHLTVTRCRLCDTELPPPALVLEDQPAANSLCETADDALSALGRRTAGVRGPLGGARVHVGRLHVVVPDDYVYRERLG